MTFPFFSDVSLALLSSFHSKQNSSHQYVCESRKARGKFVVVDKNAIPSGYEKLPLNKIVPLVKFVNLSINQRRTLADVVGYMANRKITKSYSGPLGALRKFFEKILSSLFGSRKTGEDCKDLKQDILNTLPIDGSKVHPIEKNRNDRKKIYEETLKVCQKGYFNGKQDIAIDHSSMLKNTETFGTKKIAKLPPVATPQKTAFRVVNDDTFNVMLTLKQAGANPVGINMANSNVPGGGVADGAPAQEEALCRRSNHILGLKTQTYPLPEHGVVYCPDVTVFRKDENHDYAFMDKPEQVCLVAVAAYNLRREDPEDIAYDALKNNNDYMKGTKRKIWNMLRVIALKGHETLVLGALGCGAFSNPPQLIAELFQEAFSDPEFKGRFKQVDFAILCQYQSDQKNIDEFVKVCKNLN